MLAKAHFLSLWVYSICAVERWWTMEACSNYRNQQHRSQGEVMNQKGDTDGQRSHIKYKPHLQHTDYGGTVLMRAYYERD